MAPPQASRPLPKLLLIDDDPISREVLSMVLEVHGFPVDCAEGGAEALALLETVEGLPEIILMDTQMPGLSGMELVAALRRSSTARIIAISGSGVSDALLAASDGFLLKPIEPESLAALLAASEASQSSPGGADGDEGAESSLVDPGVLAKLRAMMPPSAVREIYAAVALDLTMRLAALGTAMEAGNAAEVATIAHTLKGGCSMVGLSMATRAAARLEMSNQTGNWQKELLQLHFAESQLQSILETGLL